MYKIKKKQYFTILPKIKQLYKKNYSKLNKNIKKTKISKQLRLNIIFSSSCY